MTALRGVGTEKLCDAGSSRSSASVSTIRPPTPSTVSIAPTSRCPATSGFAEKSIESAMEDELTVTRGYVARERFTFRQEHRTLIVMHESDLLLA